MKLVHMIPMTFDDHYLSLQVEPGKVFFVLWAWLCEQEYMDTATKQTCNFSYMYKQCTGAELGGGGGSRGAHSPTFVSLF